MGLIRKSEEPVITFIDLVRKYFPDYTIEECDFILWERTCFPFGTLDMIEKELMRIKDEKA